MFTIISIGIIQLDNLHNWKNIASNTQQKMFLFPPSTTSLHLTTLNPTVLLMMAHIKILLVWNIVCRFWNWSHSCANVVGVTKKNKVFYLYILYCQVMLTILMTRFSLLKRSSSISYNDDMYSYAYCFVLHFSWTQERRNWRFTKPPTPLSLTAPSWDTSIIWERLASNRRWKNSEMWE